MPDNQTTIPFHVWKPLSEASSGELVLLAWNKGYEEYDYVAATGFVVDGTYSGELADAHGQPDFFMRFRDPPFKASAPEKETPHV